MLRIYDHEAHLKCRTVPILTAYIKPMNSNTSMTPQRIKPAQKEQKSFGKSLLLNTEIINYPNVLFLDWYTKNVVGLGTLTINKAQKSMD